MGKELVEVKQMDAAVLFVDNGMDKLLKGIEERVLTHKADVSTLKGRDDLKSVAYQISRAKTLIDDLGKVEIDDAKKVIDRINPIRKIARDFLDDLKESVRKPLTDWEEEQSKVEAEALHNEQIKIQARIDTLMEYSVVLPFMDVATWTDEEYDAKLSTFVATWEEEQERLVREAAARIEDERVMAERQVELDRSAAEQEEKEEVLRIERDAFEKEKRDAKEKTDREAFEKQAKEDARLKAEQDVRDEIARKEKEAEAEKAEEDRKASLLPDKEKLIAWAESIASLVSPGVNSAEAKVIVENAELSLISVSEHIKSKAGVM